MNILYNSVVQLIKNRIKRNSDALVIDTHKRTTFLVDESLLDKLDNLQAYLEIHDESDLKARRELNKIKNGFKTKLINVALDEVLKQWEAESGQIPKVDSYRYLYSISGKMNVNYRVYMYEKDKKYYFMHFDNRGNELIQDRLVSDNYDEVKAKFESYRKDEIKKGRPRV